jgi:hypothetical protein
MFTIDATTARTDWDLTTPLAHVASNMLLDANSDVNFYDIFLGGPTAGWTVNFSHAFP